MTGNCYHHQSLKRLAEDVQIMILDEFSNEPHGLELKDNKRWVKAVLWHPEHTYMDEMSEIYDKNNLKMIEAFIDVCREYKERKNQQ